MKLFYRKYGNGPPLIILHGLYGSSDNWVTIAKNLSDIYTVYLPDQRNHGRSPHHMIHDYDSMRNDLFELAGELKLKKFFLAGHSMGGKTAISFTLEWPEMINGLLIADISPFKNENYNNTDYNQHLTILEVMLSTDLSQISTRKEAESVISGKIPSEKVRGFILKNLERSTDNSFAWRINALSLRNNLIRIMEGIDRKADLNLHITGFPVIFLKGEASEYLPSGDFRDIQKVFPAAEFIIVPGAGHWLHSDRPDEVVKYLRRLLLED
jgi:esterase